jgi:hypothetical protein
LAVASSFTKANTKEGTVSQKNGDKARFNRERKKRASQRERDREAQKVLSLETKRMEPNDTAPSKEKKASLRF